MAEPYPVKLRARVVEMYEAGDRSYGEVGARFRIGEASVKRWVRLHRECGDVAPKPKKRLPERIAAVQAQLARFVTAYPGLRIEQINARLGTQTKDLMLPLKKLIDAEIVWTTGARRATRYFARLPIRPIRPIRTR